jgi:hypothetical protein
MLSEEPSAATRAVLGQLHAVWCLAVSRAFLCHTAT